MGYASAALFLAAIAIPAPTAGSATQASPPVAVSTAPGTASTIGALDKIEVTVFREPELSVAETSVDEGGRITLPLIGEFSAAGKSTETLATEIETRLRKYVRMPEVAVRVKQAATKRITVAGSVMEPGVFPIEGRVTLLQAVALARGPSQVADLDTTLIFRTTAGQKTVARFDLSAIARGKAVDPEVLPGDTVAVGNSKLKTAWRDITATLRAVNIFSIVP